VIRIDIETGPVVVDAAGEIYGDASNTAARVQALAEPGAVMVTARVQRQVAPPRLATSLSSSSGARLGATVNMQDLAYDELRHFGVLDRVNKLSRLTHAAH
jgi:class 3 adenylate cyclase